MAGDPESLKEDALEAEVAGLRELLAQAGIDAARLLAQAGIDATENEVAKRLQRLLLEELHHRVKNTLATVIGITSQSLRTADSLEDGHLPNAVWFLAARPCSRPARLGARLSALSPRLHASRTIGRAPCTTAPGSPGCSLIPRNIPVDPHQPPFAKPLSASC